MEQTKLQLEAGKAFRVQDGRKAMIAGRNNSGFWCGVLQDWSEVKLWHDDGRSVSGHRNTDIVAEWFELKRIKGFIAFRFVDAAIVALTSHVHETAAEARRIYGDETTAIIEIDVLEGQGLEDGQ